MTSIRVIAKGHLPPMNKINVCIILIRSRIIQRTYAKAKENDTVKNFTCLKYKNHSKYVHGDMSLFLFGDISY